MFLLALVIALATGFPANITLGGLFPLERGLFLDEYRAARLASLEINNRTDLLPGTFLTFALYDTFSGLRTRALTAAVEFMIEGAAVGVVGESYSSLSEIVATVGDAYQVPQISYSSTSPALSDRSSYGYFARLVPEDNLQGAALADVVHDIFRWEEVGLISTGDSYSNGVTSAFRAEAVRLDIAILADVQIAATDEVDDILPYLLFMRSRHVRAFFIAMQPYLAFRVYKAALSLGLLCGGQPDCKYVWFGPDALIDRNVYVIDDSGRIDEQMRAALQGFVGTVPAIYQSTPEFAAFAQRMEDEYGAGYHPSHAFVSYAYDCVYAFAHALDALRVAGASVVNGTDLYEQITRLDFVGLTGRVLMYPSNSSMVGERQFRKYSLMNFVVNSTYDNFANDTTALVERGLWNGVNYTSESAIAWPSGRMPEIRRDAAAESDSSSADLVRIIVPAVVVPGVLLFVCVCAAACCLLCIALLILCLFLVLVVVVVIVLVVVVVIIVSLGTGVIYRTKRRVERTYDLSVFEGYEGEVVSDGLKREFRELAYSDLSFEKKIGEGAFGKVFLGYWRDSTIVAVKELNVRADSRAKADFVHEANMMAKVGNHPNVVPFIGAVTTQERFFMVTEFAQNGSLSDLLAKQRKGEALGNELLLQFARDAALGLAHLHAEGIVHRDIAARNFLVTADMRVMVSDFGLSRVVDAAAEARGGLAQSTKSDVGPVRWMAPESLLRKEFSKASDVYMFGGFLYELSSQGRVPFEDMSIADVITAVTQHRLHPSLPLTCLAVLADLMKECWVANPAKRPSMRAIVVKLGAAVESKRTDTRREDTEDTDEGETESRTEKGSAVTLDASKAGNSLVYVPLGNVEQMQARLDEKNEEIRQLQAEIAKLKERKR